MQRELVVLHIETAEFVPDNTELTSLFLQLQETMRNRSNPISITHIRSHTGLPGTLAQGNDEIVRLLIGSVLEAQQRIPGSVLHRDYKGPLYIGYIMGLFYIRDKMAMFYIVDYMGLFYIPEYMGCSTSESTWHCSTSETTQNCCISENTIDGST